MEKINSFEVEARINVDVEFIKIKERFVKVRYLKPDQFEFDAEGLALLAHVMGCRWIIYR
jgi:hypothetical protein